MALEHVAIEVLLDAIVIERGVGQADAASRSGNDNSPAIRMEEAYAPYTKL